MGRFRWANVSFDWRKLLPMIFIKRAAFALIATTLFIHTALFGQEDATECAAGYEVRARGTLELYGIDSTDRGDITLTPVLHEPLLMPRLRMEATRNSRFEAEHLLRVDDGAKLSTRSFDVAVSTINPPDNAMAINTQGQILCAINSRLIVLDTNGARLIDRSLDAFFRGSLTPPPLARFLCDPRVIFDVLSRRFIVTAMTCEGRSSTSQILIAVSKTENPQDGFWAYDVRPAQLASNGSSFWFDFPNLTITEHRVVLSANLFDESRNYAQSFVLDIRKQPLLDGVQPTDADRTRFMRLPGDPYAPYPVSISTDRPDRAVLISNGFGSSDQSVLDLYEFTTSSAAPTTVVRSQVAVPTFRAPGFSPQPSSNVLLSCFDQRGAGAVIVRDKLHYVYTVNGSGGRSEIMYVVLSNATGVWRVTASTRIVQPDRYLAYPSIAVLPSTSSPSSTPSTVLTHTYAGAGDAPGIRAVVLDSLLRVTSDVVIRSGDGPVDFQSLYEYGRWADYTATVTDLSTDTPGVWTFAPYGNSARSWSNVLSRIRYSPTSTSVGTEQSHIPLDIAIDPQPIEDVAIIRVTCQRSQHITVRLVALQGGVSRIVLDTHLDAGITTFHFDARELASGAYALVVNSDVHHTSRIIIVR